MSDPGQNLPSGQFGPLIRGGRTRRRRGPDWRRVGVVGLIVVVVLMLGVVATGAALLWYGDRALQRVDVDGIVGEEDPGIEPITNVLNILVVGNDSRAGLTEEQLLRLGTEDHGGQLTDTIMLVQVNPQREVIGILSFPRDLYVTRCDGSRGRINQAHGIGERSGVGGPSCVVQSITDYTGIRINHYVEVKFAGFVDVVDTVGGVTMHIPEPGLRDAHAGLDLAPGCQRLDGIEALSFSRARHIDDDFGRIARQQRFIRELMDEVTRAGILLNVPRLFGLVDAVGRAVATDTDLSLRDMRRIAFSLRNVTPDRLDARTVPAVNRRINGTAYVVAQEEEAETLFQAFRDARIAPEGLGTSPPGELTVADVPPLVLLNGVGTAGLAAEAEQLLEERGFRIDETGNAPTYDYPRTLVFHSPTQVEDARLVAEHLGRAEVVAGDGETRLTVILGQDFDPSAVPPRPSDPSPEPAPEPRSTPTYAGAAPSEGRC